MTLYDCVSVDDEVLIHFDGWGSEYDYWCSASSLELHPPGWCNSHNWELQAPLSKYVIILITACNVRNCSEIISQVSLLVQISLVSHRPKLDIMGVLSE